MRVGLTVRTTALEAIDVLVDVDATTTVGALGDALTNVVERDGAAERGVWVDGRRLEPDLAVGDSPLRHGANVWLTAPPRGRVRAEVGWQLHVIGGPQAGHVFELPEGEHTLGRAGRLLLGDSAMSRRHLMLRVSTGDVTVEDLASRNGTWLDGIAVTCPVAASPGQVIAAGDSLFTLAPARASDADIAVAEEGWLDYNRPPRLLPPPQRVKVTLPAEPQAERKRPVPVVAVLVPLLFGLVMARILENWTYVLFGLLSPVLLLANFIGDRRSGGKSEHERRAKYDRASAEAGQRLEEARLAERSARRDQHPDPASTLLTAVRPERRLWECRPSDEDALVLRVGLADQSANIEVVQKGSDDPPAPPVVEDVPVTLPLREIGVLGISGPHGATRAAGRWLAGQLAVRHSPRDLTLVLLTDSAGRPDWQWFRWLPHARPADGDPAGVLVGHDAGTVAARVAEVCALIRSRQEAVRTAGRLERSAFAAVVVVLDGARALKPLPGVAQILADGPDVGVFGICLDVQERQLPEHCQAVVTFDDKNPAYVDVRRTRGESREHVLADQVSCDWADSLARALAPLRDVSLQEDEAQLPSSARLLDLLTLDPPHSEAIAARWALRGRSTSSVIGVGSNGPFSLDISLDGPHGLIAGTTGAGKSELLQTIVASLAVANRPDAMTFVLVDYKGGSAFKECVHLPHTVGMVTDLDAHLVQRALTSLSAELRGREHSLAAAGAKDIEHYIRLCERNPELPPMPRLLLVIDEFASMVRDLPDFVAGLVGIAQKGRSLGIHLLLATQRPSGVISPEIRANTNLRIALRVTDAAESTDVLDAPDAAGISKATPGRAYARLSVGAVVPFQAGRVGGRRPGERPKHREAPHVVPVPWSELGYQPPRRPEQPRPDDHEITDLTVLVQALSDAARRSQIPAQASPWLPPLPSSISIHDLPATETQSSDLAPIPYGLQDLPDLQLRRPALFHLAQGSHLFGVGSARAGRSQLLRTIAASAALQHSCADVHMYGIDCGSGALLPLTALPHCGAVVMRNEAERATRLIKRLTAEVERRQGLLAEAGLADITEQRTTVVDEGRLPHVLVLLDRWEGFTNSLGELDGGVLTDAVLTLLREGASVGLHVIATGDRSLVSGRVSSLTEDKLAFRMAERGDFALLGLNPRQLPEQIPAGRCYSADSGVETQIALLAMDSSGKGQAAAISSIAAEVRERDTQVPRSCRPWRVDVLPSRITFEQAWKMRPEGSGPLFGLVGVGGDDLAALGPNLEQSAPAFVVAGPPKSGRSTLLLTMARSFLASGALVIAVAPRPSPLRSLDGSEGVLAVLTDANISREHLSALLEKAGDTPIAIVLDDAELYKDCDAAEVLRAQVRGPAGTTRAVVLGGSADEVCAGFSGWQVEAKKARQGALLSPQGLSDGELIGVRVPRSMIGGPVRPGGALLHLGDGQILAVKVPDLQLP